MSEAIDSFEEFKEVALKACPRFKRWRFENRELEWGCERCDGGVDWFPWYRAPQSVQRYCYAFLGGKDA